MASLSIHRHRKWVLFFLFCRPGEQDQRQQGQTGAMANGPSLAFSMHPQHSHIHARQPLGLSACDDPPRPPPWRPEMHHQTAILRPHSRPCHADPSNALTWRWLPGSCRCHVYPTALVKSFARRRSAVARTAPANRGLPGLPGLSGTLASSGPLSPPSAFIHSLSTPCRGWPSLRSWLQLLANVGNTHY